MNMLTRLTARSLHAFERELLVTLLPTGRRASTIASKLTSVHLNSRQVGNRLHDLARQGFVTRVPANSGAYWCLTAQGKQVAKYIQENT